MPKKLTIFIFLMAIFIISSYAVRSYAITMDDIPARKSSETIEEYKARVREEKQQYLEEYKERLREEKQTMMEDSSLSNEDAEKTREQVRDRVCENIEEKIDLKVARFQDNVDLHVEKYNRLKTRLAEIMLNLEEKGYDVDNLSEHLDELDELILDYAQAYSDFIDSLIFTRGFACGESEGDFRDNLRESRELLVIAKQKRAAIREFYVEVIRKDIKELRQQAEEPVENDLEVADTADTKEVEK
jgi:hypothetical protein